MVENKKDTEELKKLLKKCLSPLEKPMDPSHVQAVINKTHQIKGTHRIWHIAEKRDLFLNRYTVWKFCILMHKILHQGHKQALSDGLAYKSKLEKYAQYWQTLQDDDMDQCIGWYCQVLLRKLAFHETHKHFKGNLQFEYEPTMDLDGVFHVCLDMLDYVEDLLQLQRVIFTNVQSHQIRAASKKGICRLSALVTITAECHSLYQHSVSVLRLLHSNLALDDVSGIFERFQFITHGLQQFFEYVRCQQLPLDDLKIPPQSSLMLPSHLRTVELAEKLPEPSAPCITDIDD